MNQCPQCGQSFTDDNSFCQVDGTPLVNLDSFVKNDSSIETPTVVLSNASIPTQAVAQNVGVPKWLYPVLGVLSGLVIILGFLAFYNFSEDKKDDTETYSSSSNNEPQEKAEKTEVAKPIEQPTKIVEKQPIPKTPKYPAVSRMKFRKGAVAATSNGQIVENGRRKFLLEARSGQYLSASVNSGNNCISINGEGSSTGYTTISGDNQIELYNNCGTTSFSLTVSIR